MKRLLTLLLALVLCLSAVSPVMAGTELGRERNQNTVSFLTGGGIIKTSEALWAWGEFGGDSVPTPKIMMDGVQSVSCGESCTLILKQDRSLWGCGRGSMLGLGATFFQECFHE